MTDTTGEPAGKTPRQDVGARLRALLARPGAAEAIALALILLASELLPKDLSLGLHGLGMVAGSRVALNAVGVVLVFRSNRIINFAQVQLGVVAATFFVVSVRYAPLLRWIDPICPGSCTGRAARQANYWISLVVALVIAVAVSWILYIVIIRRFAAAPRLTLTVATIAVLPVLGILNNIWVPLLTTQEQRDATVQLGPVGLPFRFEMTLSGARFDSAAITTVVVVALVVALLVVYLRRSATGTAIRASAVNPDRAVTLGMDVDAVTARVWLISGALSGVAALLTAMAVGINESAAGDAGADIRVLAVVVIARLVSMPMAAAGAIVFGILDQAFQRAFGSTILLDGLIFVLIGAILLVQRSQQSRAEIAQAGALQTAQEVRPIPAELRPLREVKSWLRLLAAVGALLLLGGPWILAPSQTTLITAYLIYAMVGLSLLVVTGWAGQVSLGQFAIAGVGGYAAAASGLPFLLALVAGALAGGVAALVLGLPSLRLRGLHLAIVTLAFAVFVPSVLLNQSYLGSALPKTLSRPAVLGMSFDDERTFYYVTLVFLAGVITAVRGLRRTHTARSLIALRDNEQHAQAFGINLVRARLGDFVTSGVIAGFAGALFAYHQHGVVGATFDPSLSRTVFLYTVIGGLGAVSGPLLGFAYLAVPAVLTLPPLADNLLTVFGLLLILLVFPGGLSQVVFGVRDAFLRKLAARKGIIVPSLIADLRADGAGPARAKVAPNQGPTGKVFVPTRYALGRQWVLSLAPEAVRQVGGQGGSHG